MKKTLSTSGKSELRLSDLEAREQLAHLTERVARLQESEQRLNALLNGSRDAVIEVTPTGEISYWNAGAERMLGWSGAEALGQNMDALIVPPQHRIAHHAGFQNFLTTGALARGNSSLETEALHKSGALVAVELFINIAHHNGQAGLSANIREISRDRVTDRAIRRAEERYRTITEHGAEGVVVIKDETITFANARAAEICGRTLEDLHNSGFLECVHPSDHMLVGGRHRRRLAGEAVPNRYEVRLLLGTGAIRWVSISVTLAPWDGEQVTLAFLSDITERRGLEEQLRNSLVERETILENSLVGIALLGPSAEFQWSNTAIAKIFGLTRGLVAPTDWSTLFASPDDFLRISKEIARCLDNDRAYQGELQMRRMDGTLIWVAASGKRVNVAQMDSPSVWAVIDITQRKRLEENLARTSSEREAIFNSALVGIHFEIDRRIQWVNDKFSEMMGYAQADLVGQSTRVIFADDAGFEQTTKEARKALKRDGMYCTELPLLHRNREPLWVQLAGRCLNSRTPETGVIWTVLDITERRKAESEIRVALAREKDLNHLRSQFFSATSHQFRTPLAAILSASELLRDYNDRMPKHDRVEILGSIAEGVQRMTNLLDRVQLLGQVNTNTLEFHPESIDLIALCHTIIEETQDLFPLASCTVLTRFAPQPQASQFDPHLLRHIFGNLLSNAIKYSPSGGQITFSISNSAEKIVFEVEDHGIGIPSEDMGNLFESFHRASNVGNAQGAGLGLAIVKKSVELHGGTIDVQSTPGSRTRFTVTL